MGLKVQLNGTKVDISNLSVPPVTFIDGQKKTLTKGIAFINGEKKVLWEAHALAIDYIPGLQIGTPLHPVIYTSPSKLILGHNNGYVSRVDISNISNPLVENSVVMGVPCSYSLFDSTLDTSVFYAYGSTSTNKAQSLLVNHRTGEISVKDVVTFPNSGTKNYSTAPGGMIGTNQWLSYHLENGKTAWWYLNEKAAYAYVYYSGSGSISGAGLGETMIVKKDETLFIGTTGSITAPGVATYTATEMTVRIENVRYNSIMLENNGDIVVAGQSGFAIYDENFSLLSNHPLDANRDCRLIGRIRNYYYVVEGSADSDGDRTVVLKIFDRNGALFETKSLDLSYPDNWYYGGRGNGLASILQVLPVVSSTGALGFCWNPRYDPYSGAADLSRIVRIMGY